MLTPEQVAAITARINNSEFIENFARLLEEDIRKAVKCRRCPDRCDPPFGNGTLCLVCGSRPTATCMRTMVY